MNIEAHMSNVVAIDGVPVDLLVIGTRDDEGRLRVLYAADLKDDLVGSLFRETSPGHFERVDSPTFAHVTVVASAAAPLDLSARDWIFETLHDLADDMHWPHSIVDFDTMHLLVDPEWLSVHAPLDHALTDAILGTTGMVADVEFSDDPATMNLAMVVRSCPCDEASAGMCPNHPSEFFRVTTDALATA